MRLIDQTPADAVKLVIAQLTEHGDMDRRAALHLELTSLAQVIADDVAAGEMPFGPTVARYVYARDQYRALVETQEASRG